ncbi:MAG: CotH kinase family protein [Pseudomonadota bacterium]
MRWAHLVVLLSLLSLGSVGCSSGGGGTSDMADTGFSDLSDGRQETDVGADSIRSETLDDENGTQDADDEESLVPDGVIDAGDAVQDSVMDGFDLATDLPMEDGADAEDSSQPDEPAPALNEIGCYGDEFIELFNGAQEAPADLSGFVLSDGEGPAHNYVLPSGSVIPPQGRLVIAEKSSETVGFPFGIQCGGDTVALLDLVGEVVDSVELPLVMKGNTCSRLPDGSGSWEESLGTPGEVNQPKPDLDGILFDPTQVISLALDLPEASMAALWDQPDVYVIGTFSMTSGSFQPAPMSIGVRIKGGNGSLQTLDGKPALKLKFNFSEPDQRLLGLKKLNLNNMVQDPSMLREVLSFQLLRAFAIPSPRTGYASLTINGEPYGVYLVLEAYDDVSLSMYFATLKHLYEGDSGIDVIPSQVSFFDVDEGSTTNTSDLSAFAIVASGATDEDWVSAIQEVADLPELLKLWAVEHHIAHSDGYSITINNYYLHSSSSKVFTMLPSGTDQAFMETVDYHEGAALLFSRCMAIPECLASYDQALSELVPVLDSVDLSSTAQLLSEGLAPWIASDPRMPYTVEEVGIAVTETQDFITQRRTELEQALADWLTP